MKLINKNDNQIVFSSEINQELANAIRRYFNEIPILAIDEVEFLKNDSPLYDETIAHRLCLIPITNDKSVNEKSEVKFKLNSKKEGAVYSGELKGKLKAVYDKIPITVLNKGQELDFVATAKVGKGSEHSKFSPGLMYYRNVAEITLDKKFQEEIKKVCKNEIKEKGDKIIVLDNLQKEVCDVCEGISEIEGKKTETKLTNELVITTESFGQLEVKDILKKATDFLKKDLHEITKKVSK